MWRHQVGQIQPIKSRHPGAFDFSFLNIKLPYTVCISILFYYSDWERIYLQEGNYFIDALCSSGDALMVFKENWRVVFFFWIQTSWSSFSFKMESPLDVLSRAASLMNPKPKPGEFELLVLKAIPPKFEEFHQSKSLEILSMNFAEPHARFNIDSWKKFGPKL